MTFSFCETNAAYVYHIRRLTPAGRKLGGGADTPALCGRKVSWDVPTPVDLTPPLNGLCKECATRYIEYREIVCVRKPPHVCRVNGSCNGWPRTSVD